MLRALIVSCWAHSAASFASISTCRLTLATILVCAPFLAPFSALDLIQPITLGTCTARRVLSEAGHKRKFWPEEGRGRVRHTRGGVTFR